jgi:hypothetical protein
LHDIHPRELRCYRCNVFIPCLCMAHNVLRSIVNIPHVVILSPSFHGWYLTTANNAQPRKHSWKRARARLKLRCETRVVVETNIDMYTQMRRQEEDLRPAWYKAVGVRVPEYVRPAAEVVLWWLRRIRDAAAPKYCLAWALGAPVRESDRSRICNCLKFTSRLSSLLHFRKKRCTAT